MSAGVPRSMHRPVERPTPRGRTEEDTMPDPTRQDHWDADSLVARYDEVRSHTEALAAPLSPEDQTVQSMPDVSPTKWHRAHVTWFFETFVLADHEPSFTPTRTSTGSSSTATTRASDRATPAPSVASSPGPAPTTSALPRRRRRPHARPREHPRRRRAPEAEPDHRARLPPRAAAPGAAAHGHQARAVDQPPPAVVCRPALTPTDPDPLGWVDVEGGLVEVGHRGGGFGFDNELPLHQQCSSPTASPTAS